MSVNSPINCCALYGDSASLIFNFVNIVTMFSKCSDNENESEFNTNANVTQTILRKKTINSYVILMADGRTLTTGLGR